MGRPGACISCDIFIGVTLYLGDGATGNKLHFAFGGCEVKKLTRVQERGATDAHVNFFGSITVEIGYIVSQLRTADDGVVAEYDPFSVEHAFVGYEFHFGYQLAHGLIGRGEAARPSGGIFDDTSPVGNLFTYGVSESHAYTGIGDAGDEIGFDVVFFTHFEASVKAHLFDILPFVFAGGISVIYP